MSPKPNFEQIPLFNPRGLAARQPGIASAPITSLESLRFAVYCSRELTRCGHAPPRATQKARGIAHAVTKAADSELGRMT